MAHLEVGLEHGISRKTVLKNRRRTLNAMIGSLYFILTLAGTLWNILSRLVTRFYSYHVMSIWWQRGEEIGRGARLKFEKSVRLYLFFSLS